MLGSLARLLAIMASVGLLVSGLRPIAWWRNLTFYAGLSSLLGLYLVFLIMYHSAQTAFLATYNITLPYSGTTRLSANILGLDLRYYSSPVVSAGFSIPFYLGVISISLAIADTAWRSFRNSIFALATLVPCGIRDIRLSPPYHNVWVSSSDTNLNPLYEDPDHATDDQLLVSFEKLFRTVDPGGSLSIILPAWAIHIADRFQRLLPYTGFNAEASSIIYRTPGVPETELRFRRPLGKIKQTEPSSTVTTEQSTPTKPVSQSIQTENEEDEQPPPELQSQIEWEPIKTTPAERAMVRSAIRIITAAEAPVPYRELLNRVYMDLVDKKIDFESSREIEKTLLTHTSKELELVDETDSTGVRWIRKWWLNEKRVILEKESDHNWLARITKQLRQTVPTLRSNKIQKYRRGKYRPKKRKEDD